MVPAGTGFEPYMSMQVEHLVEPPVSDEDEEASMIATATARAEALGAQPGGPTVQIPSPSSPPATTV